jgi:class 3 adenylate cyclase
MVGCVLADCANFGPIASYPYFLEGGFVANERVERRLTAILAADVAGYSRLMGADEEGTLAQLKACRAGKS